MTTSFVGFDAITASTDNPVGMLSACHSRVRKQCATLKALMPHLHTKGADDEAAAAAHRVMRYFDEAAQHHHADEEEDLFPRLIAAAHQTGNTDKVQALCIRLVNEHATMGKLWQELRGYLIRVRSHEMLEPAPLEQLGHLVEQFSEAYETHTALEDEKLLPLATKLLSEEALKLIGEHMRNRRQLAA